MTACVEMMNLSAKVSHARENCILVPCLFLCYFNGNAPENTKLDEMIGDPDNTHDNILKGGKIILRRWIFNLYTFSCSMPVI